MTVHTELYKTVRIQHKALVYEQFRYFNALSQKSGMSPVTAARLFMLIIGQLRTNLWPSRYSSQHRVSKEYGKVYAHNLVVRVPLHRQQLLYYEPLNLLQELNYGSNLLY